MLLMKLLQETPKCVLKFRFDAMKDLLVCIFLILWMKLFLNKLRTMFDFKSLYENLISGLIDFFKTLTMYAW